MFYILLSLVITFVDHFRKKEKYNLDNFFGDIMLSLFCGFVFWGLIGTFLAFLFIPHHIKPMSESKLAPYTTENSNKCATYLRKVMDKSDDEIYVTLYYLQQNNKYGAQEKSINVFPYNTDNAYIKEDSTTEPSLVIYEDVLRPKKKSDIWFYCRTGRKLILDLYSSPKMVFTVPEGTLSDLLPWEA